MRVELPDGVGLFIDVTGPKLDVHDSSLVERPTILLLHGGPGLDHTVFKPSMNALARCAQVVYVDQRGCGRSDDGSAEDWNLDQWAEDVACVIRQLGLGQPIVLGTSFGGFVAQRFAALNPDLLSGLVLLSTAARPDIPATLDRINDIGGPSPRDAAERFFTDAAAPDVVETYFAECLGLYTYGEIDLDAIGRIAQRPDVMMEFFRKGGEMYKVDLREDLLRIAAPTLILHGQEDPIFPLHLANEMHEILKSASPRVELVTIPKCRHLSEQDAPGTIVRAVVDFFDL